MSEQFATLAAALRDRADAARAEAALAAARVRVWDLAAEVAAEGGVVARQMLRLLAGGAALSSDPVSLALELGLFPTRREARDWIGPLPPDRLYYAAVFRRAVLEAMARHNPPPAGRAAGSAPPSGHP